MKPPTKPNHNKERPTFNAYVHKLYAPFAQNGHLKRFANFCFCLVGAACFFARLPMILLAVATASCYTYICIYEFMTSLLLAAACVD